MSVQSVGIIGYSHFGQYVATLLDRFWQQVSITISTSREVSDRTVASLAEVCQCDVLVLCVPINQYETVLTEIAPLLSPQTIVVDVATVKVHTERLFEQYIPNQPYICCHPMFGPESDKKQNGVVAGFRIVVTSYTIPTQTFTELTTCLTKLGFIILNISADEHDRILAETLFVTHLISQTLVAADMVRTNIDTVSFGSLMHVVESVQNDTALFADVYRYNPYCSAVIERLQAAQTEVLNRLRAT